MSLPGKALIPALPPIPLPATSSGCALRNQTRNLPHSNQSTAAWAWWVAVFSCTTSPTPTHTPVLCLVAPLMEGCDEPPENPKKWLSNPKGAGGGGQDRSYKMLCSLDVLSPTRLPVFCRFDHVIVIDRIGSDLKKKKMFFLATPIHCGPSFSLCEHKACRHTGLAFIHLPGVGSLGTKSGLVYHCTT